MSEAITHIAIVDDCLRLLVRDGRIHPAFRSVDPDHLVLARLGGTTRLGDRCNPVLLARLRERWQAGPDWTSGPNGARLAFVLGWLSHRAADRTFKIVFRELDGDCAQSPTDCSIYHDVHVLREIYGAEDGEFAAAVRMQLATGPDGSDPEAGISGVMRALLQQGLLALHTLIPDHDDPEGWIDRLFARRQAMRVSLARYATALARPDPDRTRRFITDARFWDGTEPLMRLRASQAGFEPAALDAALDAARSGCLYGQALRRAYRYVQAASTFFAGTIDAAELAHCLDLGKAERIDPAQLA